MRTLLPTAARIICRRGAAGVIACSWVSKRARLSSAGAGLLVAVAAGFAGLQPLLQAFHRLAQARIVDGFQHIIGGRVLEGGQRIVVVGGDEHDLRKRRAVRPVVPLLGQLFGRFQARLARHLDVQEQDVGAQGQALLQRFHAIGAGGDDIERRPQAAKGVGEGGGQYRFVFGDQGAHGGGGVG